MESVLSVQHAIELCDIAAAANAKRRWDPRTWQCWGCLKFSSDAQHRCFSAKAGNLGCPFINALWVRERARPA